MMETLVLASAVPAVIAAGRLLSRRSWSPALADNRGIALQTVIVIVVMLVIAGGVSTVLLSRGGDVISSLEAQDINIINNGNCVSYEIATGVNGVLTTPATSGVNGACDFTGATVTQALCDGLGGTLTGTGAGSKCSVTIRAL